MSAKKVLNVNARLKRKSLKSGQSFDLSFRGSSEGGIAEGNPYGCAATSGFRHPAQERHSVPCIHAPYKRELEKTKQNNIMQNDTKQRYAYRN